MTLGEEPAVDVDRNSPFLVGCLFADELLSLAHWRKTKALIGHDLGNGKTVMNLGHLNVLCGYACHFVSLGSGSVAHTQPFCKIGPRSHVHCFGSSTNADDPDGLLGKSLCFLLVGKD